MKRNLLSVVIGMSVGAAVMAAVDHEGHSTVRVISERDISEKLDGKDAKVSFVEVTLGPGDASAPHRHPGPALGFVLEGEYEWAINDEPSKTLKAGETFYE